MSMSGQHCIQHLVITEELGQETNTTPTSDATEPTCGQYLLQNILSSMRASYWMILSYSTAELQEIAKLADKVMEVAAPTVATESSPPTNATTVAPPPTEIEQLHAHVTSLQEQSKA